MVVVVNHANGEAMFGTLNPVVGRDNTSTLEKKALLQGNQINLGQSQLV